MNRFRVLIVEDEGIVALHLSSTLEEMGHEVVALVDDGQDALQVVREKNPDVVLMDIRLRGVLDGIDVARFLAEDGKAPVVFLTGNTDQLTMERAAGSHPFGFLVKPFDPRELQGTLDAAVCRFRAKASLKKVERWLSTTLCSIADCVVATDRAGRLSFANPPAERYLRVPLQSAIGEPASKVLPLVDTRGGAAHPVDVLLKEGAAALPLDHEAMLAGEGAVPVEGTVTAIREEGEISGAVVVFRDIRERRRAEQERAALERRVFESQKLESLGAFAGGLAHEFNNILSAIVANAGLAAMDTTELPGASQALAAISAAAHDASLLCTEMLSLAGRGMTAVRRLDLAALVKQTAILVRPPSENVRVVVDIAKSAPQVEGSPGQLRQMVLNLAMHAVDSLRDTEGTVTFRVAPATRAEMPDPSGTGDDDAFVVLEVRDTGTGIESSALPRLFDPFFVGKGSGRGLGLAAVRGIAERHRARVFVDSEPGRGTVFRVFFPAITVTASAGRAAGRVVLVYDEDDSLRKIAEQVLAASGYSVQMAASAGDVMAHLTARLRPVELLVLGLPFADPSREAALVAAARAAKVPTVLVGATEKRHTRGEGHTVRTIGKPVTPGALSAVAFELLEDWGPS